MRVHATTFCFALAFVAAYGFTRRDTAPATSIVEEQFQKAKDTFEDVVKSITSYANTVDAEKFTSTMTNLTQEASNRFIEMSAKLQEEAQKNLDPEVRDKLKQTKQQLDDQWNVVKDKLTKLNPAVTETANNMQADLTKAFNEAVRIAEKATNDFGPQLESARNYLSELVKGMATESNKALEALNVNKASGN